MCSTNCKILIYWFIMFMPACYHLIYKTLELLNNQASMGGNGGIKAMNRNEPLERPNTIDMQASKKDPTSISRIRQPDQNNRKVRDQTVMEPLLICQPK